jgi:hypothetical protein
MEKPPTLNRQLAANLRAAKAQQSHLDSQREQEAKVHVVGAGATITAGYEQLRNAAEHAEEHVLLQRAIRRFYRRLFLSRDPKQAASSGEELITELTLAGYLANDSVPLSVIDRIGESASAYFNVYLSLDWRNDHRDAWTLDVLSVEIESMLSDYLKHDVFIDFAYNYFLEFFKDDTKKKSTENHDVSVFIAVHRALLKSDPARIRWTLLQRYKQTPSEFASYTKTNALIDTLLESDETDRLFRVVNRQGAPFRVLWQMIENHEDLEQLLGSREQFLSAYEAQIETTYTSISKKITKGIVKSVIFLFITKVVIGVLIEVPYDIFIHGAIVWLPLAINLLFPPLYMVLLSNTLLLPGHANTVALTDKIDTLLYDSGNKANLTSRQRTGSYGLPYKVAYTIFILLVIGAATLGLYKLGFSVLHLVIFFIFLSTASFLGFSLSRLVREVEAIDSYQGGVTMMRDFLYMPFVMIGRWMSEKYAKINLVASVLDMVIELPLKTVLKLVRQWGAFMSDQKDRL